SILGEIEHEGTVGFESHDGKKLSKITIGYVPQHLKFDTGSPVSVSDFLMAARTRKAVAFFSSRKAKFGISESLEAAGASELANRSLGDLSGGELQRVMLAQALYPTPELLVLDEPLSGVDCIGSEQFYDSITKLRQNYHIAVAMVSHDLELVKQYADRVLLINKRLLCSGSVNDVFNSTEFRKTFQVGGGTK
ncbi:MAG: ATP-binding cassette domain-containing protein, partial [Oscillospiraceae bacterium]